MLDRGERIEFGHLSASELLIGVLSLDARGGTASLTDDRDLSG
jgi:hypothetical protein